MRMVLAALVGLTFPLSLSPALADPGPADCAALVGLVRDFTGYEVKAPPSGGVEGWCVLDGARLVSARSDQPDLKADTLRIRGKADGDTITALDVTATGLRLVHGLGAKHLDERLQAMVRLQSGDLALRVEVNPTAGRLEIRGFALVLSGGTQIALDADLAGATLTPLGVASGRLTGLTLDWKADGRLMRGAMEAVGTGIDDRLAGTEAIKAARTGLQAVIEALPIEDESRHALSAMAASLPEARGVLRLSFQSDEGIGAADLLVAGLGKSPLRDRLASLFAASRLQAVWSQGLQP